MTTVCFNAWLRMLACSNWTTSMSWLIGLKLLTLPFGKSYETTRSILFCFNFSNRRVHLRINEYSKPRIWAAHLLCPLLSQSSWTLQLRYTWAFQLSTRILCTSCILSNKASPSKLYNDTVLSYLCLSWSVGWIIHKMWYSDHGTPEDLIMCASVQQNKSKFYRLDTIGRRGLHRRNASADSTGFPTNQDSKSTSGKKSKATAAKDAQPGIRKISFEHVRINRVHCRATYQVQYHRHMFYVILVVSIDDTDNDKNKCFNNGTIPLTEKPYVSRLSLWYQRLCLTWSTIRSTEYFIYPDCTVLSLSLCI